MKTIKYRIYPTRRQQDMLWKQSVLLTHLYNQFLEKKIEAYKTKGITLSRYDLQKLLPQLKKEHPEYKEIHSQVLQQVPKRLNDTYNSFFKRKFGFPNFRASRFFFGLVYPQNTGCRLQNGKVLWGKEKIRMSEHIPVPKEINTRTITRTEDNKWFLCITYEDERQQKQIDSSKILGIDVGIKNIVYCSDGHSIFNKNHTKYYDRKIAQIQTLQSKCSKGSRRYSHLRNVMNRLYGEKSRKTRDFLHKVSHTLVHKEFDIIGLEKLESKRMSETKKTGLNKSIRNSQFALLAQFIIYKAESMGKKAVFVNPKDTSKRCSACGKKNKMPLWNRKMQCECGNVMDRDYNASINIMNLARESLCQTA